VRIGCANERAAGDAADASPAAPGATDARM
jgi:hypothetical protein